MKTTVISSSRLRYMSGRSARLRWSRTPWWLTQMIPITQKLTKNEAKEGHLSLS